MSADTRILDVAMGMVAMLVADYALIDELGGDHVYERMASDVNQIPGIYWYLPAPSEAAENFEGTIVRFEAWGMGTRQVFRLERLIRAVLHFEFPTVIDGVVTFCAFRQSFDGGADDEDEQHNDNARRVIEFEIEPVRTDRT